MISYAQNFEDVILWRALNTVSNGRYLDIGGQDPVIDSVSKAFYDAGWRGVHVEPVPEYAEKILQFRPDEKVHEVAIDISNGVIEFYNFVNTGLSTGISSIADKHKQEGLAAQIIEVKTKTLSYILDSMGPEDIHWMKVDVEGMEKSVLGSWGDAIARPWIVVVESTKPNNPEEGDLSWEKDLFARRYSFVYFDALNRFYLHESHKELADFFGCGPNVFDNFQLTEFNQAVSQIVTEKEATRVKHEEELFAVQQQLANKLKDFDHEVIRLNGHIHHIQTLLKISEEALNESNQRGVNLEEELKKRDLKIATIRDERVNLEIAYKSIAGSLSQKLDQALLENNLLSSSLLEIEDQNAYLNKVLVQRDEELANAHLRLQNLANKLDSYIGSTSWKVTAPLRFVKRSFFRKEQPVSSEIIQSIVISTQPKWKMSVKLKTLRFVRNYPITKPVILFALMLFPNLREKMLEFGKTHSELNQTKFDTKSIHQWNLLADKGEVEYWEKRLRRKR